MDSSPGRRLDDIFAACRSLMGHERWSALTRDMKPEDDPEVFQKVLSQTGGAGLPEFLSELARLEGAMHETSNCKFEIPVETERICINPTLNLIGLFYKNLPELLNGRQTESSLSPEPGEELVITWKDPGTGKVKVQRASEEILLALKIILEDMDPKAVSEEGGLPVRAVDGTIENAVIAGILLAPKSRIGRDPEILTHSEVRDESFLISHGFALQWHITQTCDLHCRHCYDRSSRSSLPFDQAIRILDDLYIFCKKKHVKGAVSFTGGNPLLYPHFMSLYRAASERGFSLSILGNPASREQIDEIIAIEMPSHFQVSLEGLQEYNDFIRGEGHFNRIVTFLELLKEYGIFSMVMLTLTRDNMSQILPLADRLKGIADRFHFNRLSMMGEGANLMLPGKNEYIAFLRRYAEETERNPILGLKDNLINILRYEKGLDPFGGCAGYGCGAAFNFLAVLPDGEVHACRKFPSPVGNVFSRTLEEIYDSETSRRYRLGSDACKSCAIRPVCGGCLASAYSHNLNIFEEKDPFCFMN
jgi:selenobiotic family peptide radical SAM maturase